MNHTVARPSLLSPAWRGAKANLLPGLILQAFALFVVLGYYQLPPVRESLDQVGELRERWGYLYSSCATALFGGLLPFLVLLAGGKVPAAQRFGQLIFYVGFWLWKGAEVDAFYRLQANLFGSSADAATIVTKTAVDQFLYNPLWAAPTQAVFFLWKDCGFDRQRVRKHLGEEALWRRIIVVLLSTWIVWIPAVSIIYTLPSALQLPLFNLVLCFWCLLLTFVSKNATN